MDLSVLICTYNRASSLRETLAALHAQQVSGQYKWEIVVMDNNSRDDTKRVVHEFATLSPVPVSYAFEGRQGKCYALNSGIDIAAGDVIAFTDDDCTPEEQWVQNILGAMTAWNADGLGGRILPAWPWSPPAWLTADRRVTDTLAIQTDTAARQVTLESRNVNGGFRVWGANMAFRHSIFHAVGRFNTIRGPKGRSHHNGEESEFLSRALAAGRRIFFDPTPTVHHRITPDRMSKSYFRKYAFDRGEGDALYLGVPRTYHVLGVAPYLMRALASSAVDWIRALPQPSSSATFLRELDLCEGVGYVSGHVKSAIRSGQWVSFRRRREDDSGS